MSDKFLMKDKMQLLMSALTVLVGIALGVAQFHKPIPEITVEIMSTEQLAPLDTAEHLEAKYWFMTQPVSFLWKIRARLENTGKRAIVGEGKGSMLLHDVLTLEIPDGLSLIRIQEEYADLPISPSNDTGTIRFRFEQWKVGETATYSFYLSATEECNGPIQLSSKRRELVEGDIRIVLPKQHRKGPRLKQYIPRALANASVLMSLLLLSGVSLSFLGMAVAGLRARAKYAVWFRKNEIDLIEFIDRDQELLKEKDMYQRRPWKIAADMRKDFTGDPIPNEPLFETVLGTVFGSLALIGFGFCGVVFMIEVLSS